MSYCNKKFSTEVSIDYPLYQSEKGNYFIGQTPALSGATKQALAGLVNPSNSNKNIYVNAMTITNISNLNLFAEFYLKSKFKTGVVSNLVSCTNTNFLHKPNNKGEIKYLTTTTTPPKHGVPIFSRIVSPYSTLVVDGGQIILSPGHSIIIYIGEFLQAAFDKIKFAFGWWEEDINSPNYCC